MDTPFMYLYPQEQLETLFYFTQLYWVLNIQKSLHIHNLGFYIGCMCNFV